MLVPAYNSPEVQAWQSIIARTAPEYDCNIRMVHYAHWDDPTLMRTLRSFAGTFFLPLPNRPPAGVLADIQGLDRRLVVINHDWTEYGLPSMRLYPLAAVQLLLDHLHALGRRRIACFNVQPEDPIVLGRIQQWRMWMARHRLEALLVHEPVEPFHDALPAAHRCATRMLDAHRDAFDSVLCITEAAAIGLVRAMADVGLRAGPDIPVCAVNSQIGAFTVPTITSLSTPDAAALVAPCLQWMCRAETEPWIGPLLIEPQGLTVVERESTRIAG